MCNSWRRILCFIVTLITLCGHLQAALRCGTQILTPTGLIPVDLLSRGDVVAGYNPRDGLRAPALIESITTRVVRSVIEITCGKEHIYLTPDQLVYDLLRHALVPAQQITVGDIFLTANYKELLCTDVNVVPATIIVYDLIITKPYLLFASEAQILVSGYVDLTIKAPTGEKVINTALRYYPVYSTVVSIACPPAGAAISVLYAGYKVFRFTKHLCDTVKKKRAFKKAIKETNLSLLKEKEKSQPSVIAAPRSHHERRVRERALRMQDLQYPERVASLLFDNDEIVHHWDKVVPSNDPSLILGLIDYVMEHGYPWCTDDMQPCYMLPLNGERIIVTYQVVRDLRRIRQAFVYGNNRPARM